MKVIIDRIHYYFSLAVSEIGEMQWDTLLRYANLELRTLRLTILTQGIVLLNAIRIRNFPLTPETYTRAVPVDLYMCVDISAGGVPVDSWSFV